MKLHIPCAPEKITRLMAALDKFEDAESTGPREYVLDLYDAEPPVTMEIAFTDTEIDILAAETMAFSEEEDGWYLNGPIEDPVLLERLLEELLC